MNIERYEITGKTIDGTLIYTLKPIYWKNIDLHALDYLLGVNQAFCEGLFAMLPKKL